MLAVSDDIETHLFPESVRARTDRLSPYLLVVVNRGSDVRWRTAALHARGNRESGDFVVDIGHRALALARRLAALQRYLGAASVGTV